MLEPSRRRDTTVVARLSSDAATVQKIADALAGSPAAEEIAVAAFEDASGRWSLAIYFRQHPDETALRALIASAAGTAAAQALGFETLAPTDWVDKSREGLAPVDAGRFVVHGAHARERARINRISVEIDAGLAFGTGHHGTTRGCLLALDRIIKQGNRRPTKSSFRSSPRKRGPRAPVCSPWTPACAGASGRLRCKPGRRAVALDVGTGTGVLAIAAAKALRRPVLASDLDRFANILLGPLQGLATPIARLVATSGQVVLSGLLTAEADAALASYRARGLALVRRIRLDGWATLVLTRPAARRST